MELEEILKTIQVNKILTIDSCDEFKRSGIANNKLYLLNKTKTDKCILKIYYKDERKRLEREYNGYEFFTLLNSNLTPKPIYRNDDGYFAIYSFVEGSAKNPSEIAKKEALQVADFIIYLHTYSQKSHEMGLEFMPAIASCFSTQESVNKINMKVTKFLNDTNLDKYEKTKEFKRKYNIDQLFKDLISSSLSGLDNKLIQIKLSADKQSLTPVDLNFDNILYHDSKAYFLDFEDFGWDDPVNIFGFFLHHDKTTGFSFENKKALILYYLNKMKPDNNFRLRLRSILTLGGVLWLSTYLLAMTEEKIKVRKFSDVNFDVEKYLDLRIQKFESKLDELNNRNENLASLVI